MLAEEHPGDDTFFPQFSASWARDFMRRHETEFASVPRRRLEQERREVSPIEISQYFDIVEDAFERYHFRPSLVSNFDESMLQVGEKNRRAVVRRSDSLKVGYVPMEKTLMHVTLGATIFADAVPMKPFVIIQNVYVPEELETDDMLRLVGVAGQDSGWMTEALFLSYVRDMYIPEIQKRRRILEDPDAPALLLADGHCSRACPDALDLLARNNIVLITPVAHSSHILQALDLKFFMVLKGALTGLRWTIKTNTTAEFRKTIISAAMKAYHQAQYAPVVYESFKQAGVWPLNRSVPLGHPALVKEPQPTGEETPKKAKKQRVAININNTILTSPEKRNEIRDGKKAALKRKYEQRKSKAKKAQKVVNDVAQALEEAN